MADSRSPITRTIAAKGHTVLENARWNKGSAFTEKERKELDLVGRLPYRINTLDTQCERAWAQLQSHESDIRKNAFLASLKTQNWVLYYALLARHLKELIPIIYTPTEAEAISSYSGLFRRSEGLFLSFPHAQRMEEDYLSQTNGRDVELIVVSDAQAILGIGDQGVGGIGISTAKSAIYTLIGGMDPAKSLSVVLDVGTDNEGLLNDPLYIGWPEKRVTGENYDRFVDAFVSLVQKHHPHSLLHFEDFGVTNAQRLLRKYRPNHSVFNDDIQGTGAVTLAALTAAIGVTKSKLSEQRIIIYGAGSAGLGIAHQIRDAIMLEEREDESRDVKQKQEDASGQFYLIDKHGLITTAQSGLREGLEEFARAGEEWSDFKGEDVGLLDVVKKVKPTVLIGTSTHAGAFTKEVVEEMSKHVDRPIIFPLSNPSRLVEVHPKDANDWSNNKALLATGSPFDPVKMSNGKMYEVAECNNALIYPGLGLGAILSRSRSLSDKMIIAGTRALASLSPALKDPDAALLPDFGDSPDVSFEVTVAVVKAAIEEGEAGEEVMAWVDGKKGDELENVLREKVKETRWVPQYDEFVYGENGET